MFKELLLVLVLSPMAQAQVLLECHSQEEDLQTSLKVERYSSGVVLANVKRCVPRTNHCNYHDSNIVTPFYYDGKMTSHFSGETVEIFEFYANSHIYEDRVSDIKFRFEEGECVFTPVLVEELSGF